MESRYRYVEFGHYRVGSRIIPRQTGLGLFGLYNRIHSKQILVAYLRYILVSKLAR